MLRRPSRASEPNNVSKHETLQKPPWLRVRLGQGDGPARLRKIIDAHGLHTVCSEAMCPNLGECWEKGRATVMILGRFCSRNCRFCSVSSEDPSTPDPGEPARVAGAVKEMGLGDVVITSVTRDDIPDGGASIWAETIARVREAVPGIVLEALVPDFAGSTGALDTVLEAGPDVLGHNIETVPSLYASARPDADYLRSIRLIQHAHESGAVSKSAIMLGLGESRDEVSEVMADLVEAGCDIFFLGQYLQPTKEHLPVRRYVPPEEFDEYRRRGLEAGFKVVVSAPLVRSSYHSEEQMEFLEGRKSAGV